MPSAIPPESEIAAFAEAAGHVDAEGRYTAPRAQLIKGTLEYRDELAKSTQSNPDATARRLVAFRQELVDELEADGVELAEAKAMARDIMSSTAQALVRRSGLHLQGDPHP